MSVEHEGKRLYQLSDRQIIEALRGRGNELQVVKGFAFLVRMFETAAKSNPVAAPGLMSAIGLTQLYGRSFASGHEEHPFADVDANMTVASIMADVPRTAPLRPGPKPRVYVERGSTTGGPVQPQNAPRVGRRPNAESKVGIASALMLARPAEFTVKDIIADGGGRVTYADVQNAITKLIGKGTLRRNIPGVYSKRPAAPVPMQAIDDPSFPAAETA